MLHELSMSLQRHTSVAGKHQTTTQPVILLRVGALTLHVFGHTPDVHRKHGAIWFYMPRINEARAKVLTLRISAARTGTRPC
jgi:hypothetical protein